MRGHRATYRIGISLRVTGGNAVYFVLSWWYKSERGFAVHFDFRCNRQSDLRYARNILLPGPAAGDHLVLKLFRMRLFGL
jgi:hypothetical protein